MLQPTVPRTLFQRTFAVGPQRSLSSMPAGDSSNGQRPAREARNVLLGEPGAIRPPRMGQRTLRARDNSSGGRGAEVGRHVVRGFSPGNHENNLFVGWQELESDSTSSLQRNFHLASQRCILQSCIVCSAATRIFTSGATRSQGSRENLSYRS